MRVLFVPDKFKGTLTAGEAAAAMARGWLEARPGDQVELLPMSDGGDGFGEIIGRLLDGQERVADVVNAAQEPVRARWWWSETRYTAVVESAEVIGLAMLPAGQFHPFNLDTFGLGQLLDHISAAHPHCAVILGIGGSATNDGGFGLARALGFSFAGAEGERLERWTQLRTLRRIDRPVEPVRFRELVIACDVENPLLGPHGASRIYGPQKGLAPADFPLAEACLQALAGAVRRDLGIDAADEPGSGAAGGLGFGLKAFLGGRFEPGFDIFARLAQLDRHIRAADLIVTGEGAIDAQTLMGKGTGAVARLAQSRSKPCLGLAGVVRCPPDEGSLFSQLMAICPTLAPPEEARQEAAKWLQKLAAIAAREFGATSNFTR